MKHIGNELCNFIEHNRLSKKEVAEKAGISSNYLSIIFKKSTIDCSLFERICKVTGFNPATVFEIPASAGAYVSDIHQQTVIGSQTVAINEAANNAALLAEKERTIQLLMKTIDMLNVTNTGHN